MSSILVDTCQYCDSLNVRSSLIAGTDIVKYRYFCRDCGEEWVDNEIASDVDFALQSGQGSLFDHPYYRS